MSAPLELVLSRGAALFQLHPIAALALAVVLGFLVGLVAAWLYFSFVVLEGAFT